MNKVSNKYSNSANANTKCLYSDKCFDKINDHFSQLRACQLKYALVNRET